MKIAPFGLVALTAACVGSAPETPVSTRMIDGQPVLAVRAGGALRVADRAPTPAEIASGLQRIETGSSRAHLPRQATEACGGRSYRVVGREEPRTRFEGVNAFSISATFEVLCT